MLKSFLLAYPWDLHDEGVDDALDRLSGEVGVTGLSVWAGAPPSTQLRLRDMEPRIRRCNGGLLFEPAAALYTNTRLKPCVSPSPIQDGLLGSITSACAEREMELRLRVSAACTGLIAEAHPAMAARNVFGDTSRISVCLANPDVQAYLSSLVIDLSSNLGPSGLILTDFTVAWMEAVCPDLYPHKPAEPVCKALLSLCFCESCRQKADAGGIDVQSVAASVRTRLEAALEGGENENTVGTILADEPELAAYYMWRAQELSELLKLLDKACDCDLLVHRRAAYSSWSYDYGADFSLPAAVITELEDYAYLDPALNKEARRSELAVPAALALGADSGALLRVVSRAGEMGFTGFEVDNYALLCESAMTPLRQAVRFAKRAS